MTRHQQIRSHFISSFRDNKVHRIPFGTVRHRLYKMFTFFIFINKLLILQHLRNKHFL